VLLVLVVLEENWVNHGWAEALLWARTCHNWFITHVHVATLDSTFIKYSAYTILYSVFAHYALTPAYCTPPYLWLYALCLPCCYTRHGVDLHS